MILNSVRVKNYKCINDSTEFKIDQKVTCLVGKNESGKTALLQAISKLNPVDPNAGPFDILEYPRHKMIDYRARAGTEPADALITTWTLAPSDIEEVLAIIGPAAEELKSIKILKGARGPRTSVTESLLFSYFRVARWLSV